MPRRGGLKMTSLLTIAFALAVVASGCTVDDPAPRPACTPSADAVLCAESAGMQAARVARIVDGDTLHVEIDGRDETVRLFGINAPEVGQPCADEATARLRALAAGEVRLLPDVRDRDRYGRLLRYVYAPDGLSIDATLVAEGLALAWRKDGALRSGIIALEEDARGGGEGCLWDK
ncbi:MAG: thermonuclease family protein [Chloroflexi bacterium]|nr:thermonuclease family protein [Chloroflexota bacterium]